eukprot:c2845_g1_i1 orf=104-304(+)
MWRDKRKSSFMCYSNGVVHYEMWASLILWEWKLLGVELKGIPLFTHAFKPGNYNGGVHIEMSVSAS